MDRLTLRFLDDDLERAYQRQAGAESLNGYRLITLASAVIWALAAFVLPASTSLAPELAIAVGLGMSALSLLLAYLGRWATTLDRQHLLATLLTTANGTLIVALATIGGALPGYAVAAVSMIFAWGFVSRTRFIYAALRSAVIATAFLVAVAVYPGPANLVLDVVLFAAGAVGVLLALHRVERVRRRLFVQELVIREQADQLTTEMQRSTALIHNILPASVAERLLGGEQTIADDYPAVTVLFADIVGFTPISARLDARALIDVLSRLFVAFDRLTAEHGVVKVKTIGDAYMAVGGLRPDGSDQAAAVVRLVLLLMALAGGVTTVGDAAAASGSPAEGQLVDIGGRRLYLQCEGTGGPVVILQAGLGNGAAAWSRIQPVIAATTTVCSYDRAGRGRSDDAPGLQDGHALASDLHELLARAGVPGPYLLVAHSSGASYVRVYTADYPDEVLGMVLLDPQPSDAFTSLPDYPGTYGSLRLTGGIAPSLARLGLLAAIFGVPQDQATAAIARSQRDEIRGLPVALQQAAAVTTIGDRPLVVVSAGTGAQRGWAEAQDGLAALSTESDHRRIEHATHASLIDGADAPSSAQAVLDVLRILRADARAWESAGSRRR